MSDFDRSAGPFSVDEEAPERARIDFGCLKVAAVDGMEIRVEMGEAEDVAAVTVILAGSGLQLQAFAAPRSEGLWDEIRAEIATGITEAGGSAQEELGPFGTALAARVPVQREDGAQDVEPVRFWGVDGPRWLLRGVVSGRADDEALQRMAEIFRDTLVDRGSQPAPPREPLPLQLPDDAHLVPQSEPG